MHEVSKKFFFVLFCFSQHCLCLTLDLLQSCEVLLAPLFGRAHALEVGYHWLRAESAIFEAGWAEVKHKVEPLANLLVGGFESWNIRQCTTLNGRGGE